MSVDGTVFDEGAKVCVHARDGICGGWHPSVGGWREPELPPRYPPKGWGWSTAHIDNGWSRPAGGWVSHHKKPSRRPVAVVVKGGWKGGAPVQLLHDLEDGEDGPPAWDWGQPSNTNSYWSFTPSSSYVVVYDTRGRDKKRSVELP